MALVGIGSAGVSVNDANVFDVVEDIRQLFNAARVYRMLSQYPQSIGHRTKKRDKARLCLRLARDRKNAIVLYAKALERQLAYEQCALWVL